MSHRYNSFVANLAYDKGVQEIHIATPGVQDFDAIEKNDQSYNIRQCKRANRQCYDFGTATIIDKNNPGSYSMPFPDGKPGQCNVRLSAKKPNGQRDVEQVTCMSFGESIMPTFWQYRLKDIDKSANVKSKPSTYMFEKAPIAWTHAGSTGGSSGCSVHCGFHGQVGCMWEQCASCSWCPRPG